MDLLEFSKTQPGQFKRHPWETSRSKIIRFLLRQYSIPFSHLLDVGSGDAFLLDQLSDGAPSLYSAVDPGYNEDLIHLLKTRYPHLQYFQTPDAAIRQNGPADLVLLLDVLEHVDRDDQLLQQLASNSVSSPSAHFLITVPAYPALFSTHDERLGHRRRYTLQQLKNLCLSSQLAVIASGYFFFGPMLIRKAQKIFHIASSGKTVTAWNASGSTTRIVESLFWLDFRLARLLSSLRINLPGLSCYCICQKLPS